MQAHDYERRAFCKVSVAITSFSGPAVSKVYDSFPPAIRAELLKLRELIFSVAATLPSIGALEESLKWGEPAILNLKKIAPLFSNSVSQFPNANWLFVLKLH